MRRLTNIGPKLLPLGIVFLAMAMPSFAQSGTSASNTPDPEQRKKEFLNTHVYGGEQVAPDAFDRALEQWQQLPRTVPPQGAANTSQPATAAVTGLNGQVWMPFGPSPLQNGKINFDNGRVNAIAVNPNNPNLVYQGSAGGGLWRSTNADDTKNPANWTPLFDQQVSLGIGEPSAVAIDPTNTDTIYVGTSAEQDLKGISKGILKSTDGGGSWIVLGKDCDPAADPNCPSTAFSLFAGGAIHSIIVDPTSPNTLYLASGTGLFFSVDSGLHWTPGNNVAGNAESLVLDATSPTNNRILFAGVNGQGIFQSKDGGKNWTQVLNNATVLPGGGTVGRVMLAIAPPTSPPNPAGIQVVYATIEAPSGASTPSIFKTINQGGAWPQQTASGIGTCQCFFTNVIGVDPASPGDGAHDILYWGGTSYARSITSGASFTNISNGLHADAHAFAFAKDSLGNTIVFTGNDGGIWRSDDNGTDWTGTVGITPNSPPTLNAGNLQTTLFYHMDVQHDPSANVTVGALQDNGLVQTCSVQPAGSTCSAPPTWMQRSCCDGIDVVFDAQTLTFAYGVVFGGSPVEDVYLSKNSGDDGFLAANFGSALGIPANERGGFLNQVSVDPNKAGFVYVSGSATSLFQNKNAGAFTNIKNNFPARPGEVDVAPANSNNVAVAVGNGVFVSTNALSATPTFTNITRNLPARNVNEVAFDPNDPTVVYAVLAGFNNIAPAGHVFRTTIAGTAWTPISPAMDVPFLSIALDGTSTPTTIYAGTAIGVIRSVDGGTTWTTLDDIHFPHVPVTELKINSQAGVLRASTFGRGVFDFAPATGPVISLNAQNGLNFGSLCAGGTANLTLQVFNVGTQDLVVNSVQNLFNSPGFSVLPNPSTPVTIMPGSTVVFTVQFTAPSAGQTAKATIRVSSNDPGAPFFDLAATGVSSPPTIAANIANSGNFGNVCVSSFADLPLTVTNTGGCTLSVTGINSSSPEFSTASPVNFPLTLAAGSSLQVPIRFRPVIFGPDSGNIGVSSNDPANPTAFVAVTGNAPRPREPNSSCSFIAINAGGSSVSPFLSDRDFSGGTTISHSNSINLNGQIVPAPRAVYQTARVTSSRGAGTTFSYTISGFTPGTNHAVRLHFAETFWTAVGQRVFNISINGPPPVLSMLDVFKTAGGQNRALIEEFPATADASGKIVITFTTVTDKAMVSGIEVE